MPSFIKGLGRSGTDPAEALAWKLLIGKKMVA
jgi:hypothetical protein